MSSFVCPTLDPPDGPDKGHFEDSKWEAGTPWSMADDKVKHISKEYPNYTQTKREKTRMEM